MINTIMITLNENTRDEVNDVDEIISELDDNGMAYNGQPTGATHNTGQL